MTTTTNQTTTSSETTLLEVGTVVILKSQWDAADNPNVEFEHWDLQKFVVTDNDEFFKVEVQLASNPDRTLWVNPGELLVPTVDFFD